MGRHLTKWLIPLPAIFFALFPQIANAEPVAGLTAVGYVITSIPPARSDTTYQTCGSEIENNINRNYNGEPFQQCPADNFMIHMIGLITVPQNETISFMVAADDGGIMKIGDVEFGDWNPKGCTWSRPTTAIFTANTYALDSWFYESGGLTCSMLAWNINNGGWQIVPDSAFTYNATPTTTSSTSTTTTTQVPTTTSSSTSSTTSTLPEQTSTTTTTTQSTTTTTTTSTTTTTQPPFVPTATSSAPIVVVETVVEAIPVATTIAPQETTTTTLPQSTTTTLQIETTSPETTTPTTLPQETTTSTTPTTTPTTDPSSTLPSRPQNYPPETTLPEALQPQTPNILEIEVPEEKQSLTVTLLQGLVDQSPAQILSAIQQVLTVDITSDEAVSIATSPQVLAVVTQDQAEAIFEQIVVEELTAAQADELVAVINDAPIDVKEAFQDTINVFSGLFDSYQMVGSTIPVGERKTLVAISNTLVAVGANLRRKNK